MFKIKRSFVWCFFLSGLIFKALAFTMTASAKFDLMAS